MDFTMIVPWILGGLTVVGCLEWFKGFAKAAPTWIWGVVAMVLSIGWAIAPDWLRLAAGVLSISQIGYATIIQAVQAYIGSKTCPPEKEP